MQPNQPSVIVSGKISARSTCKRIKYGLVHPGTPLLNTGDDGKYRMFV